MSLKFASSKVAAPRAASRTSTVVRATFGGKKNDKPSASEAYSNKDYLLSLPGVTAPFPDVFDPLGLSDKASVEEIRRWRESELMHGRVAMLASLGFVIGEQLEDFPAFVNFDGAISGPAIMQFQQVVEKRPLFWEALVLIIGLTEAYRVGLGWATPRGNGFNNLKDDDEYSPGELGFDPLGLLPTDEDEIKVLKTKELNNGRLAMIGIAGFVAQELVLQQEIFEHLFLRFEKEVIEELDVIEKDLGLPITSLPSNLKGI